TLRRVMGGRSSEGRDYRRSRRTGGRRGGGHPVATTPRSGRTGRRPGRQSRTGDAWTRATGGTRGGTSVGMRPPSARDAGLPYGLGGAQHARVTALLASLDPRHYRVEKMRFGKAPKGSAEKKDRTVVQYNDFITVRDIPLAAYDYVVNGKPAIEW